MDSILVDITVGCLGYELVPLKSFEIETSITDCDEVAQQLSYMRWIGEI